MYVTLVYGINSRLVKFLFGLLEEKTLFCFYPNQLID